LLCAFLDDSKQDGWLGLLGLVIDSERLIDLEKKFAEVLRAHGVPIDDDSKDTEIKWSPGKGKWLRDGLKEGRREALYRGILDLLEGGEAALVGALLHHAEMKGYDEERAYSEAYVHTFERVDALAEVKRTPVIVLADSEGGKAKATERVKQTLGLFVKARSIRSSTGSTSTHRWWIPGITPASKSLMSSPALRSRWHRGIWRTRSHSGHYFRGGSSV